MTLLTSIYVQDETNISGLLRKCQELLLAEDPEWGPIENIRTHDKLLEVDKWRKVASREMGNDLGQNLPAWLEIHYGIEGKPYRTAEQAREHRDYCEEDCDRTEHDPACFAEVTFDTAYGYQDEYGGCGHLHARLICNLGAWLDGHGVAWGWKNEFTGELWFGADRYEKLIELADGGESADTWFRDVVRPVIMAEITKERGSRG